MTRGCTKTLFTGEIKFERFYQYLQYASLNTFIHLADVYWDEMVEQLEDDSQEKAADWFFHNMTRRRVIGCERIQVRDCQIQTVHLRYIGGR